MPVPGADSDREQQRAWLQLARRPRLDASEALQWVAEHGGLLQAASRSAPAHDPAALAADLDWLARPGHGLLTPDSALYPPQLLATRGAPVALFVSGDPAHLSRPQLAIVGSRAATAAGRETARRFADHIARAGIVITSGLAAGIDQAAHRAALAAGCTTVAVCGTGLDVCYPSQHAELARQIAGQGALVSEFSLGTPPCAANFPQRNRILCGLALGVLVIEAAHRSGSLITARLAGEQGREVMAVPGSIYHALARGCHRLIRDGAALVESPEEVLALLGFDSPAAGSSVATQAPASTGFFSTRLDSAGEMLLNALGFEPADIDQLAARTGLAAHKISGLLQLLELDGSIESLPGGQFCRTPPRQDNEGKRSRHPDSPVRELPGCRGRTGTRSGRIAS